MKFNELGLSKEMVQAVERIGFEEATPVQQETIPYVLQGIDVIGQAQTGTGKTAAFGLPTLEKIDARKKEVQALVVAPTRELAIQTQEELYRLGKEKKIHVQAVYGGSDIKRQVRILKGGPQIVVGTPGRLLDHIKRKTIKLQHVETLVLDEADEMLNMGFLDDIEAIIKALPKERQTLLFSATMPEDIKRIGVQFMKEPKHIKIKSKEMTASLIEQFYINAREEEKFDMLTRLIDVHEPKLAIIFGRTKRRVDELSRGLRLRGYNAEGIHGDLSQAKRSSVLKMFKREELNILVATDVAARGLDISGVTHVYNYDIPQDPESYVHRIGRTGRAGKNGLSVTFVAPNERTYLQIIEKLTKKRMLPMKPPTAQDAFEGRMNQAIEEVNEQMASTDLVNLYPSAEKLLQNYEAIDLVSLLLSNLAKEDALDVPVKITPEKPLPRSKQERKQYKRHRNSKRGYQKNRNYQQKPNKNRRKEKHQKQHKSALQISAKRNFTIRQK